MKVVWKATSRIASGRVSPAHTWPMAWSSCTPVLESAAGLHVLLQLHLLLPGPAQAVVCKPGVIVHDHGLVILEYRPPGLPGRAVRTRGRAGHVHGEESRLGENGPRHHGRLLPIVVVHPIDDQDPDRYPRRIPVTAHARKGIPGPGNGTSQGLHADKIDPGLQTGTGRGKYARRCFAGRKVGEDHASARVRNPDGHRAPYQTPCDCAGSGKPKHLRSGHGEPMEGHGSKGKTSHGIAMNAGRASFERDLDRINPHPEAGLLDVSLEELL